MYRSRKFYLSLLGAVAWSTTAANTVLDILDAVSLSAADVSFVGLSITASALDVLSLSSITAFSAQYAWTREGIIKHSTRRRRILATCAIVLSVGALAVSLASIITIRTSLNQASLSQPTSPITDWNRQFTAHISVWALACLSQILLYSSPLWSRSRPKLQPVIIADPRDSVMSEVRHSNHTADLYALQPTQPSSPLAALPSPTFSTRSSNSLKSWKTSLQHVVRPVTSRSKLVRDERSIYSDSHSIDNSSQNDGFDTWEVDPQTRVAAMQLASIPISVSPPAPVVLPSRRTALETIPGSRPASPAHALDGPFPASDDENDDLPPPPKMMPDTSRPPSPAVSEAHIHPLFRTESPTPPPAATPGTSILASPLANQMITCPQRPYNRMRSNSNLREAASPGMLSHSQSFTRDRALSRESTRSRSVSPISREMTPPIPDFVLNSSPRSSTSGTQRKVNLQPETSR